MENKKNLFFAFTLAEMMVVMLIMSIALAAFAPVMTTKMKTDKSIASSSPWKWSNQGVGPHAYFASSRQPNPMAMIGQENPANDDNGRLIINTQNDYAHILFKHNGVAKARLYVGERSLILGNQTSFDDDAQNTVFGVEALAANRTGRNNVAIGYGSMYGNEKGSNNVAIGNLVMVENENPSGSTNGSNNVALGNSALQSNAGKSDNVAIGNSALQSNAGNSNVAIGNAALNSNEEGSNNVALGSSALKTNTIGENNIAIGTKALYNNGHVTTYKKINEGEEDEQEVVDKIIKGNNNTAIGYLTMQNNTSGSNNIAIGNKAMYNNTTGTNNVAIGINALYLNQEGSDYIAIGHNALYSNTTGTHGVAVGLQALEKNTSGIHNIGIGYAALQKNTSGNQNLAIGCGALQNNTGNNNIAIGYTSSQLYGSGSNNTALGVAAMQKRTSGSNNTALGYAAMKSGTEGNNNTAVGLSALLKTSGSNNTAIGYNACAFVTDGSNVTCIGAGSGPSADRATQSNVVYLGTADDTVYIPGNLVVDGHVRLGEKDDSEVFVRASHGHGGTVGDGNLMGKVAMYDDGYYGRGADVTSSWIDKHIWHTSDRRLKYVGSEYKSGLDKIKQLKVFNYTFKKDPQKTPKVGVIAQDLQKVFPNAVTKGKDGFLMIRMEDMFYALVNAVKELDAKIVTLTNEVKKIAQQVNNDNKILKQVQNDNKQLKKENAELKARLDKLEQKLK